MGVKFFQLLSARQRKEPLTITAVSDIARWKLSAGGIASADRPVIQIRYGDTGEWSVYTFETLITLNKGEKCQLRNLGERFSFGTSKYLSFSCGYTNDRLIFSGDLLSLVNWRKELPEYCFYRLFYNMKQLTAVPEIPDMPMADNAFAYAFANCSILNSLRVRFKTWSGATNNWVSMISSSGTFYKPSVLPVEKGNSKIPSGWKVVDID